MGCRAVRRRPVTGQRYAFDAERHTVFIGGAGGSECRAHTSTPPPTRTPRGGHVGWGVANRWRRYLTGSVARGATEVAGGVERVPGTAATGGLCAGGAAGSEALRFPVRGGSWDPAAGRLEVRLGGSVRFWGHAHHGTPARSSTRRSRTCG